MQPTSNDRVFLHYDKLSESMIRELLSINADPISWAVCINHINKLPQYQYRCDLSQGTICEMPNADVAGDIVLIDNGVSRLSQSFIDKTAEAESNPIVVVKTQQPQTQATPAASSSQKQGWTYADNLFAGIDESFYSYLDGNKLINRLTKEISDLDEFCEWRREKHKKAIPVSYKAVMAEYMKWKSPKVVIDSMEIAKSEPKKYRTVNLTDREKA